MHDPTRALSWGARGACPSHGIESTHERTLLPDKEARPDHARLQRLRRPRAAAEKRTANAQGRQALHDAAENFLRHGADGAPRPRAPGHPDSRHRRRRRHPAPGSLRDLRQRLRTVRGRATHPDAGDSRTRAARPHREDRRPRRRPLGRRCRRPHRGGNHAVLPPLRTVPLGELPPVRHAPHLLVHPADRGPRSLGRVFAVHVPAPQLRRAPRRPRTAAGDRRHLQPARRRVPLGGGDAEHAARRHGRHSRARPARPRERHRLPRRGRRDDHRDRNRGR